MNVNDVTQPTHPLAACRNGADHPGQCVFRDRGVRHRHRAQRADGAPGREGGCERPPHGAHAARSRSRHRRVAGRHHRGLHPAGHRRRRTVARAADSGVDIAFRIHAYSGQCCGHPGAADHPLAAVILPHGVGGADAEDHRVALSRAERTLRRRADDGVCPNHRAARLAGRPVDGAGAAAAGRGRADRRPRHPHRRGVEGGGSREPARRA